MQKKKKIFTRDKMDMIVYTILIIWLLVGMITKDIVEILSVMAIVMLHIFNVLKDIKEKVTEFDIKVGNVTIKNINYNAQGASDEQS